MNQYIGGPYNGITGELIYDYQNNMTKKPKDLKVEIGSPEQVFWTDVKGNAESHIKALERELKINNALLEIAQHKINLEKELQNN